MHGNAIFFWNVVYLHCDVLWGICPPLYCFVRHLPTQLELRQFRRRKSSAPCPVSPQVEREGRCDWEMSKKETNNYTSNHISPSASTTFSLQLNSYPVLLNSSVVNHEIPCPLNQNSKESLVMKIAESGYQKMRRVVWGVQDSAHLSRPSLVVSEQQSQVKP